MCPSILVAAGGSDSGGSGGQGAGSGGGGGPGTGGGAADGTGGDGKAAPDPNKYPLCGTKSHPVDVVTGRAFTHPIEDFEIAGPVPFTFERTASSKVYARDFGFGPSWAHTLGWELELRRDAIWAFTEQGTKIAFPLVEIGDEVLGPFGWKLRRDQAGYELDADDEVLRRFDFEQAYRRRLTAIRDRNDNRISLSYSANGVLEGVVDSGGRVLKVVSDERGHIQSFHVSDGKGQWIRLSHYDYDGSGRLTRATDPDGHSHHYGYNDRDQLTLDQDRAGLRFHFVFDSAGRCVESWGDYGDAADPSLAEGLPPFLHDGVTPCKGIHHCVFVWGEGGFSDVIDSTQSSRFQGNAFGLIDKAVEGGAVTTAQYRADGHILQLTDGTGATTKYERTARGALTRLTDPLGRVTTYELDGWGLPIRVIDPVGNVTELFRDHRGNIEWTRDPAGGLTRYEYDPRGLVTKVVTATNAKTLSEWDAHGNLITLVEPNGSTWRYTYDLLGRRSSETDPLGNVTRYEHTLRGDLVAVIDPQGHATHYTYDGEGHLTSVTTPKRATTRLLWGGYHKLVRRQDPNGAVVRLGYNVEGELTHVWNERGELHRMSYSSSGLLVEERTFDGRVIKYTNDAVGRAIAIRNGLRETMELVYDLAGQMVGRKFHDDSEESFEYDPLGDLVAMKGAGVEVRFERDPVGRIVREVQSVHGAEHSVEVRYDLEGERVGRRTSLGHTEEVTRDASGDRVASALDGVVVQHKTDGLGREVSRLLSGGGAIDSKYDSVGRLEERTASGRGGTTPVIAPGAPEWVGARRTNITAHKAYAYDPDGEVVTSIDRDRGATKYEYDPIGQVLAMLPERARAELYRYDATGNILEEGANGGRRVYGTGSRLLRKGDTEYRWDDDGRLAEKRTRSNDVSEPDTVWRFRWNAAGLLAEATRDDGLRVSFLYDPLARRLEKTVYRQRTAATRASVERKVRFVWDGDVLVHEIKERGLATADPVIEERTYWFEDDGFEPLAHKSIVRGADGGADGVWFHYVNDQSGVPERLLAEDGSVAAEYRRSAWGALELTGAARADTAIRLQGQYYDEETGLSYCRFRYYEDGAFISVDPLLLDADLNGYRYAPNAFSWIDPFGLAKLPVLKVSRKQMPEIAKNIAAAQKAGAPSVLTRTCNSQKKANRKAALKKAGKRPPKMSADEYPFASSKQGGKKARVKMVPVREQNVQGGQLSGFYSHNGIKTGDKYRVKVVP